MDPQRRRWRSVTTLLQILAPLALIAPYGHAATATPREIAAAHRWAASAFRARSAEPRPFAFIYDGRSSATLLPTWRKRETSRVLDAARTERTLTFADRRSGLEVKCVAIEYRDFPAVEWVETFRNTGTADTPILEDVHAAWFSLTAPSGDFVVHYSEGSHEKITDFRPRQRSLAPGERLDVAPYGGRSSDGVMPFFNVAQAGGGAVIGVGWSGQWAASFHRTNVRRLDYTAGMERTHLLLHPGERIRTPSTLLLFYDGDVLRGHNLLRSLILAHFAPRPGGQAAVLPIAASGATVGFNNVSAINQKLAIANIADKKLPVDTYWIDAGWSAGGFPLGMGTWDPDPVRFPHGLKPVGDAAHAAGLKFLVWFEPERVMPGSWLRVHHPEWLLNAADLPKELGYEKDWGLLNLGDPAALAWATRTFSGMVSDFGVDIYRNDFNMHPLYFWRTDEPSNRQGMNEVRYIEGLYAYFDALQSAHPNLLLDNCASGGRRIDFEMMRRTVPLLRTDYLWDPVGAQSIMSGLSYWIPLQGQGGVSTDPYDFRSGFGDCSTYAFDFYSPGSDFWGPLTARIAEYRQVRPLFTGDYYPLTPYSTEQEVWFAWQFDRADLGEGIVQAFRRSKSEVSAMRLKLVGLDPRARYNLVDMNGGPSRSIRGDELSRVGLDITLDTRPGSALIRYRKER